MKERKDVAGREARAVEQAKAQERAMLPPVDIYEDESSITLRADMPGISKDRLEIQIDGESLSIAGDVDVEVPGQMNALYADVRSTRYQRNFVLSSELDRDRIDAGLKDGVLTVRIPKREERKPRKIEVRTG